MKVQDPQGFESLKVSQKKENEISRKKIMEDWGLPSQSEDEDFNNGAMGKERRA